MQMTFRWYGPADPVPLAYIRQIPGMTGVVSALHDVPVGERWTPEALGRLKAQVEQAGLAFAVVESIFVHEDIKLGLPGRDALIDDYCRSLEAVGALGVGVVCYNFMPVFDWMRTDLAMPLPDGSAALAYDQATLEAIDLSPGTGALPGWGAAYTGVELAQLQAAYAGRDPEELWDNLTYFLERIVPVAEASGVKMALHPDDPPWPLLGLPRIITSGDALERVTRVVDSPANGITFCTGSLGASAADDLPALVRRLKDRIHFVHLRNVLRTGDRAFHEVPHPSPFGSVDMLAVMQALAEIGFDGPVRPDHGRMIWGEAGRAGYGLYDRALGAMYLQGLWEGITRA